MGVDTKLYLDSKWEIRDIVNVLELKQKEKVEVIPCDKSLAGCFHINVKNRQIFTMTNYYSSVGTVTLLMLSHNDQAVEILKSIASVLGGLFIENDIDEKLELIDGKLSPNNGIPYFAKHIFMENDISVDDYAGFIKAVNEWYKRIDNKPQSFNVLTDLPK